MNNFRSPSTGLALVIQSLNLFTIISFCFFVFVEISVNVLLLGTSAYEILTISLFLVFSILFFIVSIFFQKIILSKSLFFLILFIGFIAFRALFDFNQISSLLTYTIRSNGGILFYAFAGIILISQQNFLIKIGFIKSAKQILFLSLVVVLISMVIILFQLIQNVSDSIFLINVLEGVYQQPANLMIVQVLLFQILSSNLSRFNSNSKLINLLIVALCFISMIASQAFGSNTGFVMILVLLVNFLTIAFIANSKNLGMKMNKPLMPNSTSILNTYTFYLLLIRQFSYFFFIILILAILLFSVFFDFLTFFRIFGYGDLSSISSIESRFILLKNFYPQFEISPFFGNLASDRITTGQGTFPHSLFLSLLTHTGILGALLFIVFLGLYLRHIFIYKDYDNEVGKFEKIFRYKNITVILILISYSTLATFFTWPPLWFFIGLTMGALKFIDYEKKNISPSY